jgi:YfiH family protein
MVTFDIPTVFQKFPGVIAAQSTRIGGIRDHFFSELGITEDSFVSSEQVHGKEIFIANISTREKGYDAIITQKKGLYVGVSIADCTPILIYDPVSGAVAAIHAGWRGTVQKISAETVLKMEKEFGTRAADCYAYIGACISERAFEVENDVADFFDVEMKKYDSEKKNYFVDLKHSNAYQLMSIGVPASNIEISSKCTVIDNERYFSYRKEKGTTGRMLAIIGMR